MDITGTASTVLPDQVWLGEGRRQLLVRSDSEPDIWRLVSEGRYCTCPGWSNNGVCRHVRLFPLVGDVPVVTVRPPRIRLGDRQELLPEEDGLWRLVTHRRR